MHETSTEIPNFKNLKKALTEKWTYNSSHKGSFNMNRKNLPSIVDS